jgi:integrase
VATHVTTLPIGDHTDPAVSGLQLRVRTGRRGLSRSWFFRYRWRGEAVRLLLGRAPSLSLADAREAALRMRGYLDRGIDPRRAESRRIRPPASVAPGQLRPESLHSIETLTNEFIERYIKPHRKGADDVRRILDKDVLSQWRGRDARTIKPREVIELLDGIVARGSPVMANRVAGILSQLFKFGIHRALVETSPVQLLMRPGGKERPRERVLTNEELRIFLRDPRACCRFRRLSHVITLLLLTGQRRGELAQARWEHIDFAAKTWKVPPENTKTHRGQVVPLSDWAVREFQALQALADDSPWVLPGQEPGQLIDPKLLTRGLAKCADRFRKQGIGPFHLHDLRRTCRTGLARLKIPPHIAERVLNHAQERIAGTYDVYDYLEERRAALNAWAHRLQEIRAHLIPFEM